MNKAAVIIPNLNGRAYLERCLTSLEKQSEKAFSVILVDNGSTDDSVSYVKEHFPRVILKELSENTGFCHACNEGIRMSREPYVILLNNDTECGEDFVREMIRAIEEDQKLFSCSAKMLSMDDPSRMDDAGDLYNALGWAFARGKGKSAVEYNRRASIFASCGGAAIYRRSLLEVTGLLDEAHFAYLEDMDLGYRARIYGYRNAFAPRALVLHKGSASSGSRYNAFKVRLASRNSVYLIYKNMPLLQVILNAPLLAAGFLLKWFFFIGKGLGMEYAKGVGRGLRGCRTLRKVPVKRKNLPHYLRIQWELWVNLIHYMVEM